MLHLSESNALGQLGKESLVPCQGILAKIIFQRRLLSNSTYRYLVFSEIYTFRKSSIQLICFEILLLKILRKSSLGT